MRFPGYVYESELNETQSRVGWFVKSNILYVRRVDLEEWTLTWSSWTKKKKSNKQIINIYRPFNSPNSLSPLEFFKYQIDLISIAYNNENILVDDINLDWNRKGDLNYHFKNFYNYMEEKMEEHNLIQMVNFRTWSRVVNNVLRSQL
jgi:hypothetical protein